MQWMLLFWSLQMMVQGKVNDNSKSRFSYVGETETIGDSSKECECVPFYQCNNAYGIDVIQFKFGETEDKDCDDKTDICCVLTPEEKLSESLKTQCGIRNLTSASFSYRIKGNNNEANLGEFPWMVAIKVNDARKGNIYKCGGSIVHPRVVLTAAHCIVRYKVQQLSIVAGDVEFQTPLSSSSQTRKVEKIIPHEKFHRGNGYNDIAILILETPFILNNHVGLICLGQNNITLSESCIVSGWGKDTTAGEIQQILRLVEFPMVPRDKCEALLRTNLSQNFDLHQSFICAGGIKGTDSCKGDGGSPLVCPVKDSKYMQYEQVGIVSWGVDCATETPGVYTNVALFVDWITDTISNNLKA